MRSQYDTLPDVCGLALTTNDVDVASHVNLKDEYLGSIENSYRFFLSKAEAGKTFIDTEIYYPVRAYSITRQGRCGVKLTLPPLGTENLITLNQDTVINPEQIAIVRATNNRTFYNEIDYAYDADDQDNFTSLNDFIDDAALNQIGISSVLPIDSRGIRSDISDGIVETLQQRANALLTRYSKGAIQVTLSVMWSVGNQIEAGDIVALDGTNLNISNFQNGTRSFGVQLMEVVDRTLNISSGNSALTLLGGVGASVTDRFATIAPSSVVGSGSTTSGIVIVESFTSADPLFPSNEGNKWNFLSGDGLLIHDAAWTYSYQCIFKGIDPANNHILQVSGLSYTPVAGDIVEIAPYSPVAVTDIKEKAFFLHISPTAAVISASDQQNFTVSSGDYANLKVGMSARIHNEDFTHDSGEVTISALSVVGAVYNVKVSTAMGFTPSGGEFISLLGFLDGGGPYRWL
jgi:hypothetical protein